MAYVIVDAVHVCFWERISRRHSNDQARASTCRISATALLSSMYLASSPRLARRLESSRRQVDQRDELGPTLTCSFRCYMLLQVQVSPASSEHSTVHMLSTHNVFQPQKGLIATFKDPLKVLFDFLFYNSLSLFSEILANICNDEFGDYL